MQACCRALVDFIGGGAKGAKAPWRWTHEKRKKACSCREASRNVAFALVAQGHAHGALWQQRTSEMGTRQVIAVYSPYPAHVKNIVVLARTVMLTL